jgi:glycosyltransferase involved in cell wall biosynthesis
MTAGSLSHLAFFLPSLRGGGAERVILDVAREAARHVEKVDLVLVKHEGIYANENLSNVNVVDLNASRSLASVPRLANYIRLNQPQAMISAMPHANIAALLTAWLAPSQTRLIISEHSIMSRPRKLGAKLLATRSAMRLLYPRADLAIAVSEQVQIAMNQGTGISPAKTRIVHNPINLTRIRNMRTAVPTHPWLADKTTPVIVTAGRLVEEKDQETLIRALAAMSLTQTRLVIFGEGPLRPQLELLRRELGLMDRVDLPGFVTNPYAEFANANVFALPSKSEGFANVVIEALACDTPVVAMRATGGIADNLEDGAAVRLVDIGNDQALAVAIERCLINPPAPAVMQSFASGFSLERGWNGYRAAVLSAMHSNER